MLERRLSGNIAARGNRSGGRERPVLERAFGGYTSRQLQIEVVACAGEKAFERCGSSGTQKWVAGKARVRERAFAGDMGGRIWQEGLRWIEGFRGI